MLLAASAGAGVISTDLWFIAPFRLRSENFAVNEEPFAIDFSEICALMMVKIGLVHSIVSDSEIIEEAPRNWMASYQHVESNCCGHRIT